MSILPGSRSKAVFTGNQPELVRSFALVLAVAVLLVSGCASTGPAPVIERAAAKKGLSRAAMKESDWRPQIYVVQKGDTLYSIALEHGFDYKDVASWNGIDTPYVIKLGQQLRLTAPSQPAVVITPLRPVPVVAGDEGSALKTQPKAIKQPYSESAVAANTVVPAEPKKLPDAATPATPAPEEPQKRDDGSAVAGDDEAIEWGWPASGKVIAGFKEGGSAKGVDIAGKMGQAVFAAGPGKIVYSGSGLRGYGKLIIIKHNKIYLTAYAHNSQILVKEGQVVAKGQKIAEIGDTDADRVKLHFEIRRLGKPVDPMKYLPNDRAS